MSAMLLNQPAAFGLTTSAEQVAAVLAAATEDLIVATDPTGLVTVFNAGAAFRIALPLQETGHATEEN